MKHLKILFIILFIAVFNLANAQTSTYKYGFAFDLPEYWSELVKDASTSTDFYLARKNGEPEYFLIEKISGTEEQLMQHIVSSIRYHLSRINVDISKMTDSFIADNLNQKKNSNSKNFLAFEYTDKTNPDKKVRYILAYFARNSNGLVCFIGYGTGRGADSSADAKGMMNGIR
jgi:hypothetical protein